MGISTIQSYRGAQIFEAIGLNQAFIDKYFTWTASRVGGIGLDVIAAEVAAAPRARVPRAPAAVGHALDAGGQYQYRRERRVPPVQPGDDPQAAARLPHRQLQACSRSTRALINDQSKTLCTLRGLLELKSDRPPVPHRGGRAGRGDRQALQDRRDVVRLDQQGGARDAGDRDEPHRRQEQHRRGRRGSARATCRTPTATRGTARSSRSPPGASASPATTWSTPTSCRSRWRRARSPARAASCPGHKVYPWIAKVRHSTPGVGLISPPPHHDIYSIEDLARADPRPEERQPARAHQRQAGRRGRRRHDRGGRRQGARRRGADQRPRRRHGRVAADQHQARRHPVGAGPGRDAPDAGAEQPAQPHRRRDRRPAEDRARRRHRRAARRRGVRLRDGAAGGDRLHHDARLPPEHLPGRRRDAGSGAAQEVHRQTRSTSSTSCASSPRRCAS